METSRYQVMLGFIFKSKHDCSRLPMAYKGLEAILSQIGPTAEVVKQIMPVYNFKAGT